MTPSPRRRTLLVGLFVLVALGILAAGILMVGSLNDTFTRRVAVTAVFAEVNGLQRGDNVWYAGLKVGVVRRLSFDGDAAVLVEMNIDQDAARHIRADVEATIATNGLLGSPIVALKGGSPGARELGEGDALAIGQAVSTDAMLSMLQENNVKLLAITTDLGEVTGRLSRGEGTVGRLLQDDALYDSVVDSVGALQEASIDARGLTASLSAFAADLNRPGSLPKALVTDQTSYASLQGTVAQLRSAGDSAAAMMDGLEQRAARADTPLGVLTQDADAGEDLRRTLSNVSEGSALLNEDLQALQHSVILRRYFRRRERAAARGCAPPEGADGDPP